MVAAVFFRQRLVDRRHQGAVSHHPGLILREAAEGIGQLLSQAKISRVYLGIKDGDVELSIMDQAGFIINRSWQHRLLWVPSTPEGRDGNSFHEIELIFNLTSEPS